MSAQLKLIGTPKDVANIDREKALEAALALVEHGKFGLAFSSGSAATVAALQVLKPGDKILAGNDTYGGTYRIFERILRPWGVDTRYIDAKLCECRKADDDGQQTH